MQIFLNTQHGEGKQESEDRVLVCQGTFEDSFTSMIRPNGIVAVADGVGGNNAGGQAADFVCSELAKIDELNTEILQHINELLLEKGGSDPKLAGMATTLSGLHVTLSGRTVYFHVGNTRIYAIQANHYLTQITRDDTVVDYLVRSGKLSEEEALVYPSRNEITACFGGGRTGLFKIVLKELDSAKYTHFLITSDGVHEHLTTDDMEDILDDANGDWAMSVKQLVENAKENGSRDDCTAVIIAP